MCGGCGVVGVGVWAGNGDQACRLPSRRLLGAAHDDRCCRLALTPCGHVCRQVELLPDEPARAGLASAPEVDGGGPPLAGLPAGGAAAALAGKQLVDRGTAQPPVKHFNLFEAEEQLANARNPEAEVSGIVLWRRSPVGGSAGFGGAQVVETYSRRAESKPASPGFPLPDTPPAPTLLCRPRSGSRRRRGATPRRRPRTPSLTSASSLGTE